MKRRIAPLVAALISLIALVCGAAGPAFAGAATDAIMADHGALSRILARSDGGEELDALFDACFEHQAMAEALLGDAWEARTAAERAEYSALAHDLLRASSTRYVGETLAYDIEALPERLHPSDVVVTLHARPKRDARAEPLEIAFVMVPRDGGWKARDVVIEGVSMVSSYRRQFAKIIQRDGFPALIDRMRAKLQKLGAGAKPDIASPTEDLAEPASGPPARAARAPRQGFAGWLLAVGGAVLLLGLFAAFRVLRAR